MLTAYETAVQQLLQLVNTNVIPVATLDSYINTARMQLAADAECIRAAATLALSAGVASYTFAAMLPPAGVGIGPVFTVRSGYLAGATVPLEFRPWEWFAAYYLASSTQGTPTRVAQHGQGSLGTLTFSLIPNAIVTATFDVVCLPIDLANDSTPEAIPSLWTDAVPFYAAWLAMMQLQRQADAHVMLTRYQGLALRGRQGATPTELPDNLPGGAGAHAAALKSTLMMPPQAPRAGG